MYFSILIHARIQPFSPLKWNSQMIGAGIKIFQIPSQLILNMETQMLKGMNKVNGERVMVVQAQNQ